MPFPSSSQDSPGESVTLPHVGVLPSGRPSGRHSHHPLRVGQPWGTGAMVGAPSSCSCTPPGPLTDPMGKSSCLPSSGWGPPFPPLHIHMKALHTHLHRHALPAALLPARHPCLLSWLLALSFLLPMSHSLCIFCAISDWGCAFLTIPWQCAHCLNTHWSSLCGPCMLP